MGERFVDRIDKKKLIKSCPDFKLRRHGVPPIQVVYSFVAALLAVVLLVGHLVIKLLFLPDNVTTPNHEILAILFTIAFCITAVAVFSSLLIYKIRDLILETEFQNLIFASAGRINTDFCLIVNENNITMYCDYNFSQLFSAFEDHADAFNRLVNDDGVKKPDKDKLTSALKNGKSAQVTLNLTKPNGESAKYNVNIDPLSRPAGYSLIRGVAV